MGEHFHFDHHGAIHWLECPGVAQAIHDGDRERHPVVDAFARACPKCQMPLQPCAKCTDMAGATAP